MRLIVNPIAGRGYASRAERDICKILKGFGVPFDVVRTRGPNEAVTLAEQASLEYCHPVVAVGGDGTVHEVLNGLVRAHDNGGPVGTLGVIPTGSGNDFEYMLNVPDGLEGACRKLAEGKTRLIDVGRINDRYFANGVGIGFDATVNIVSRRHRRLRGLMLYLVSALEALYIHYRAPTVTINYDGTEITGKILMVSVANGRRIGGGFMIAPTAEIDDGLLDLCVAREVSRPQILTLIPHVIRGTHVDKPPVTMLQARKIVVTSDDDLPSHVDGEIFTTDAHRLEMEILPRRLRVVVG
jgi:YegS/Rv2252/BmrU family lipid kinase